MKTEVDEVERNFRTHALAAFVLCKTLVPAMRDVAKRTVGAATS